MLISISGWVGVPYSKKGGCYCIWWVETEMLLNVLQCMGQPSTTQVYPAHNVNHAESERCCFRTSCSSKRTWRVYTLPPCAYRYIEPRWWRNLNAILRHLLTVPYFSKLRRIRKITCGCRTKETKL